MQNNIPGNQVHLIEGQEVQYMGAKLVSFVFPTVQTTILEMAETFSLSPTPYCQMQEYH